LLGPWPPAPDIASGGVHVGVCSAQPASSSGASAAAAITPSRRRRDGITITVRAAYADASLVDLASTGRLRPDRLVVALLATTVTGDH
jgi:hypothetical protein